MSDVKLGGKLFTRVNLDARTVRLDQYLDRMLIETGLDTTLPEAEDNEVTWPLRLQLQLRRSGKACDLLGGYLLPMGVTERQWTVETARATADFIGGCDTEEDRKAVDALCLEVALGFFRRRLASLRTFLSSSNERAPSRPESRSDLPAAH